MAVVKVVSDGTYAVLVDDVSILYKTDVAALPPAPAADLLMVIPKGIGKPQSPQFRFTTQAARDSFYTQLVAAMG